MNLIDSFVFPTIRWNQERTSCGKEEGQYDNLSNTDEMSRSELVTLGKLLQIADRRDQERKAFARIFQPSGKSDKSCEVIFLY
jgi:hypothetical protein